MKLVLTLPLFFSKESRISPRIGKESRIRPRISKESRIRPRIRKESRFRPRIRQESRIRPRIKRESRIRPRIGKESRIGQNFDWNQEWFLSRTPIFGVANPSTIAYVTYTTEQSLEALEVVSEAKVLFRLIQDWETTDNGSHQAPQHLERTIAFAALVDENATKMQRKPVTFSKSSTNWQP